MTEHKHRWKVPNPVSTAEVYVHCLDCGKVGVVRIGTREPTSELEKPTEQEVEIAKRIVDHGKNYRPGFLERIEDWMDRYWPWRH